jgi:hypothetical protein
LPSALREIASKVFFLWPNCLAGEAAFFGQRTKTLSTGFPCFNGLGCFLPCPGHAQFLLKAAGAAGVLGALDAESRSNAPPSVNPALTTRRACTAACCYWHKTHRLTQACSTTGCESRIIGRALGDPKCIKVITFLGDRVEYPCYGHVQSQLQNLGKTAHVTEYRLFSLWLWSTAIRSAKNMAAPFANTI